MKLSALLVCVDETAAEVLRRVLEELGIRVEFCPDPARATMRSALERFDVMIVDGESGDDVISFLRETRLSRKDEGTLAVAVVPTQDVICELFSLGVNFVLYKPVAYERALSSLRAARALMRKEKRKSNRAPVHAHATVDYANVQQDKATLVNLSPGGMAVLFGKKLPPTAKVYFQFQLPGQKSTIRLSGQVVWQDWNGRGGVQFMDVPKASRRLVDEYLGAHLPKEDEREPRDIGVEMEEPVPVTVGPAAEFELAAEKQSYQPAAAVPKTAVHNIEAPVEADANNRRAQIRYACRLGAEVYRSGTSVPNHCCLTDLSSGGCYLEVPLPFPQGASVEIVVRTHEMKLRVRGKVLASHPGFGMGISFELTKEEQENVKKLTDFVAATQSN